MNKYDDIIYLPHYEPHHERMPIYERSAQFSPFAALSGHAEAIKETARITDKYIKIDDSLKEIINRKLQIILNNIKNNPEITITYFEDDLKKIGGKYITKTNKVLKINLDKKIIIIEDKTIILFDNILNITSNDLNFNEFE